MVFNKLVRDRIPDIIERSGAHPITRILNEEEYLRCLEEKLDEEVREFHEEKNLEELADILEVVCALAEAQGGSPEELRQIYLEKHERRGGFSRRIFLIAREDAPTEEVKEK